MKIALYQHLSSDGDPIIMSANKYMENDKGYIRVSEIMDVDFKELEKPPREIVADKKIAAARKARDEAQNKLEALENEV